MIDPSPHATSTSPPTRRVLIGDALFLAGFSFCVGCLVVWLGPSTVSADSPLTRRAAVFAAFVAGHSAVLAYLVTVLGRDGLVGPLLSIAVRTGVPAAALLLVREVFPDWFHAGFGGFLVVCYLPCLAMETTLAAWRLNLLQPPKSDSSEPPSPDDQCVRPVN